MSSKYRPLTEYLAQVPEDDERRVLTFREIEEILGFELPKSAFEHQAWWANQGKAQSQSWMSIGWKTAALDLEDKEVMFYRYVYPAYPNRLISNPVEQPDSNGEIAPLTVDEAKAGLAKTFGLSPDHIEIVIRV